MPLPFTRKAMAWLQGIAGACPFPTVNAAMATTGTSMSPMLGMEKYTWCHHFCAQATANPPVCKQLPQL